MSAGLALAAAPPDAARALRTALGSYPTGVTIVTARGPAGEPLGLTVNSFAPLSLEPPLLLWSLANRSANRRAYRTATHFAINVLGAEQSALARRFAGSPGPGDRFEDVEWQPSAAGTPLLAGAVARFDCECRDTLEIGDHTLFIGRVVAHDSAPGAALLFHRGAFATSPAGA